jgi:membrane-associated protein
MLRRSCHKSGKDLKMDAIIYLFNIFMHLDQYLSIVIQDFGYWTYLIIFLIIFCETGLVVTPILPGDSLLFGLGYFASIGALEVEWLIVSLAIAAIAGDSVNYAIGKFVGPKVFYREKVRFLKKEYLDQTHRFYEKHGGKTIILARFIPIIRTYAPFVAGIGIMTYRHFIFYNVVGGVSWVLLMILGGYYFGDLPIVRNNFTLVVLAIIFISILPGLVGYFRQRSQES